MTLSVIGTGFGRTGTGSMKRALEILGLGPCHHLDDLLAQPAQPPFWRAAAAGQAVEWRQALAGFRSQMNWPGAFVWRELAEAFPQARLIHTVRHDEDWWQSFSHTLAPLVRTHRQRKLPEAAHAGLEAFAALCDRSPGEGLLLDRQAALTAYHQRTMDILDTVLPSRVLVFDVTQDGWKPLCKFLGVPVPDVPFPHLNRRDEFWGAFGGEPG